MVLIDDELHLYSEAGEYVRNRMLCSGIYPDASLIDPVKEDKIGRINGEIDLGPGRVCSLLLSIPVSLYIPPSLPFRPARSLPWSPWQQPNAPYISPPFLPPLSLADFVVGLA